MSDALPESLIPTPAGDELSLEARPRTSAARGRGNRLAGQIAVITDGATGIGQAVAVAFAREGANVVIAWLNEHEDAARTVALIEAEGRSALSIPGDIGNPDFATELVRQAVAEFGRIDILVNNAAEQHVCTNFEDIPDDQVERSFRTNILGQFWLTKAALPHMADGTCIINTGSVSAYRGNAVLVDYAASKAAVVGFTRSLALHLAKRGIRVNAVAPGAVGDQPGTETDAVPMQRFAEPDEIAPSYVFLASTDAAYMTGQVLHPNGGVAVGG
jgi:NAD(P)-dependent dehydrogenase (short-subunit alcohol dehydrogenase family)